MDEDGPNATRLEAETESAADDAEGDGDVADADATSDATTVSDADAVLDSDASGSEAASDSDTAPIRQLPRNRPTPIRRVMATLQTATRLTTPLATRLTGMTMRAVTRANPKTPAAGRCRAFRTPNRRRTMFRKTSGSTPASQRWTARSTSGSTSSCGIGPTSPPASGPSLASVRTSGPRPASR